MHGTMNIKLPLLMSCSRHVIYIAPWKSWGLFYLWRRRGMNSQKSPPLGNYIGKDDCHCRCIRRLALTCMYVVLRQAPKKVSYGKLVGTTAYIRGTRWRSSLRHFTTSRKIAGSIPDDVILILHWHNSSGPTMAPGLTQPLTEMSSRSISWG